MKKNETPNKQNKILKILLSLTIIIFFILLILTILYYNFTHKIHSDYIENDLLYNFKLYLTGNYKIQDNNYTNILEITNNPDNSITYVIYTFNPNKYLIEQKIINYNLSNQKLQEDYSKYKSLENDSNFSTISNVQLTDNYLSYDINSVNNRTLDDLLENKKNNQNSSIFILE